MANLSRPLPARQILAREPVQRLRVQLKADGGKTVVTVQNSQGAPESGDAAKRIIGQLSAGLR